MVFHCGDNFFLLSSSKHNQKLSKSNTGTMHKLKVYNLCNGIAVLNRPVQRKISSSGYLFGRKFLNPKMQDDVGIRIEKKIHREDDYLQQIEDEGDEQLDFMKLDEAYDLHYKEKRKNRDKLAKMIARSEFIAPAKQPSMLTYAEKEYIRFLHQKDPIEWDIKSLSESFPATPLVIKKILKSRWKPSPERIKKSDLIVEKNWELLAEGKLDADPDLIAHLQNFTGVRKAVIEKMIEGEFNMQKNIDKKKWNHGEMSGLLESYEKKLQEFQENRENEIEVKKLTDKNAKKESAINILNEKIQKEKKYNHFKEKESFTLGVMLDQYKKETTLENLQKSILTKAKSNEKLSLYEKAILESNLNENSLKNKENVIEKFAGSSADSVVIQSEKVSKERFKPKFKRESVSRFSEKKHERLSESKFNLRSGEENEKVKLFLADKNTQCMSESEYGKFLMKKEETISIEKIDDVKSSVKFNSEEAEDKSSVKFNSEEAEDKSSMKFNSEEAEDKSSVKLNSEEAEDKSSVKFNSEEIEDISSVEFDSEEENFFYNQEEKILEKTAFWESGKNSRLKALEESRKPSLNVPQRYKKIPQHNDISGEYFPLRINIPKNKRGSGLTFKVNDCYYDDDGEFLYRVPGMMK